MEIIRYTGFKEILSSEGKMLTDGNNIASAVMMPIDADETVWYEIDKPEDYGEQDI